VATGIGRDKNWNEIYEIYKIYKIYKRTSLVKISIRRPKASHLLIWVDWIAREGDRAKYDTALMDKDIDSSVTVVIMPSFQQRPTVAYKRQIGFVSCGSSS